MRLPPALKPPPFHALHALHQRQDLRGRPRAQATHQAVQHDDERHEGHGVGEEEMGPVGAEAVPAREPERGRQQQHGEEGGGVAGLQLQHGEAGGGGEGVAQHEAGERVGEVVECEGEEVEGFLLVGLLRGGGGERRAREGEHVGGRGAGVYGGGDVVQVRGGGAGALPGGDVREEVCEDEVDGGRGRVGVVVVVIVSAGGISVRGGGGGIFSDRVFLLLLRVVLVDGFEGEGFVDFTLELRSGPAGAGAEVDEDVFVDRSAEDRLQDPGDERSGREGLEGREACCP